MAKPGPWPFLLAVPALAVGVMMLNFVMHGFRAPEAFGGAALVTAGAGLIGLGIGQRGKKAVGIVVFLVGAGSAFGLVKLAMIKDAQTWEQVTRESARERATQDVCQGKTIATTAHSSRNVTRAYRRPAEEEYGHPPLWMPSTWPGLPTPSTAGEIDIVACITSTERQANYCTYEAEGGGGSLSISIVQLIDEVAVRDAKTGMILGTKTFEGEVPNDKCDTSIKVNTGERGSRTSPGRSPDGAAEEAFVRTFLLEK